MIKTMKIAGLPTSFMVVFFAFSIVSSCFAADEKLENLLKKPGIAALMQSNYGGKSTSGAEQDTPLVKQAKAFALRINPPPPPEPVKKVSASDEAPRPKAVITAKFKLIGTSYHIDDDSESWALIDEVGKGLHWVKQGGKVGYLTIEKVGDGGVLVNDNGRKYELLAERQTKPDLVKSYTGKFEDKPIIQLGTAEKITGQAESVEPVPVVIPVINAENVNVPALPKAAEPAPEPEPVVKEPTPEELLKQTEESIEWLKQIEQDPNYSGMSSGEANELGGLGEMLQTLESELKQQQEANAVDSNSTKAVQDVNQAPKITPKTSGDANDKQTTPASANSVNSRRKTPQNRSNQQSSQSTQTPAQLRKIRERK